MSRIFGTDGVRGIANTELTSELAYNLGRAGAFVLTEGTHKPRILVAKDTRISGDMLEAALVAGILSVGAEAIMLGVVPTPAVAYLTREYNADAGVMISASHNPVEYNGIKFFDNRGYKLSDELEDKIQKTIEDGFVGVPSPIGKDLGKCHFESEAVNKYMEYAKSTIDVNLERQDLFGGNVEYPNDWIVVGVLFLILTLYLPCTAIYRIWDIIDEINSDYMEVSFDSYEIDDTILTLRVDEYKQPFRIWEYTEYDDDKFEQFFNKIKSGEKFQVFAKYIGGKSSSNYIIYNLCDEKGEVYVYFDKANEIDKIYFQEMLPFSLLLPFVWILICIIVIVVVRNKKKIEAIKSQFIAFSSIKRK